MIDGGKGQLNAARAAFRDCDLQPPTLISLAKKDEEIYLPDEKEPIRLGRESFALRLLQYIRDEAHRFAQHYHHILRNKSSFEQKTGKPGGRRNPSKKGDVRESSGRESLGED